MLNVFRNNNKISPILLLLYIFINSIVLINAILHDPAIGYDAREHIRKIPIMAQLKYPNKKETVQFSDPPLHGVLPAMF